MDRLAKQRVFIKDTEVTLTKTEYLLLIELTRKAGKIVTVEELLKTIWGNELEYDSTHALRQIIYRLRQKIEADPKNPIYIKKRAGFGYLFDHSLT